MGLSNNRLIIVSSDVFHVCGSNSPLPTIYLSKKKGEILLVLDIL